MKTVQGSVEIRGCMSVGVFAANNSGVLFSLLLSVNSILRLNCGGPAAEWVTLMIH